MNLHVISLPHTITTKEYLSCAYTQKILNFCKMMKSLGHTVYHYGGEGSNPDCTEHISIISNEQREMWFGNNNWKKELYSIVFNPIYPYWIEANNNAIREIGKRIQKKDFICVIGGYCQKPIADAFPNHITVEFGIGYEGTFAKYRVFESYAWMHYLYGKQGVNNGNYMDAVIPNYFDPADFSLSDKENYFVFIGRLIQRKGASIAAEVCNKLGVPLIMAGQGVDRIEGNKIIAQEVTIEGPLIKHIGTVGVKERNELMSKAQAVFVQTQYIGPFEGVSVEAMLCGTPVITTDWGCFAETVIDGVTGYRTRSFGETLWAAQNVKNLDSQKIRDYALSRYSIDVVKYLYQDYFERLLTLWDKGWYSEEYDPTNKRVNGNWR